MGKKGKPPVGEAGARPPTKQEADKPVPDDVTKAKKRAKSDIDDIFSRKGGASHSKAGEQNPDLPELQEIATQVKQGRNTMQASSKRPKVEGTKDDIFGEEVGKARKRTEEGFRIFSEEELGLSKKGGNTDLCPFDCECCF